MLLSHNPLDIFGGALILPGEPQTATFYNVTCVPGGLGGEAALFTQDGLPIEDPERGPVRHPEPEEILTGDFEFIYGGVFNPHFGHFLIESMARLWPLAEGLKSGQRLIMCGASDPEAWWSLSHVRTVFEAFGLTPASILNPKRVMLVPRLVVPESSIVQQSHVRPVYGRTGRELGEIISPDAAALPAVGRPVYLSKLALKSGVTGLRGEDRLCAALSRAGVDILIPEELSLAEKIRLFASRRVVSGWVGSSHHASVFSPRKVRFELLCGQVLNSNFILVDKAAGNASRYWLSEGTHAVAAPRNGFQTEIAIGEPEAKAEALLARIEERTVADEAPAPRRAKDFWSRFWR